MVRASAGPPRFPGHEHPQVVPVPDQVRPGGPAPWARLAPESRRSLTLALVEERLRTAGRLFEVAPAPERPAEIVGRRRLRRSAVLVALFEEGGETHLILTRRSTRLRSHRGEIALPGGRSDLGETPVETALRETYEEVGIAPGLIAPIGWLNPIATLASDSAIWPVVGRLAARPTMVAHAPEVDRVFTVALSDLAADGVFVEERWRRDAARPGADDEGYVPIYFYAVPGELIWGATARVLTELLCVATGVPWPDANRVWT